MGQDQTKLLQKQLFDIKFTAKQLTRESQKADKREAEQKAKLRAAMKKGEMERAKILAENALREHQQSLSLLKLSARMEAVAQRIEQALVMGKVTKSMSKTVDGMEAAFASLDATKISKIMDRFSEQFDEVDLKTKVMGDELDRNMDSAVKSSDVENLMKLEADAAGIEISDGLLSAPSASVASKQTVLDPEERLRNLGS